MQAGDARLTDTRQDEQDRCITIKSTGRTPKAPLSRIPQSVLVLCMTSHQKWLLALSLMRPITTLLLLLLLDHHRDAEPNSPMHCMQASLCTIRLRTRSSRASSSLARAMTTSSTSLTRLGTSTSPVRSQLLCGSRMVPWWWWTAWRASVFRPRPCCVR